MNDININRLTFARLQGYIKGAVSQGAFLSLDTLFQRFEKTTQLNLGGKRQRQRYLATLKNTADSPLKFVKVYTQKGQKLYVTSKTSPHFDDNYDKEALYAKVLLEALQKNKIDSVKAYETLLKKFSLTKKSLERIIRKLKEKADRFGLIFFKIGRDLHVKLKYPYCINNDHKSSKNIPHPRVDVSRESAKDKEVLRNTPQGDFRFKNHNALRRKAFSLCRQLSTHFYDNCKVKCCRPMLFKFAFEALKSGYEDKVIETKFYKALMVRHADATDMGLNRREPKFKFEMSSTVSLANQYLRESQNKNSFRRWENLIYNVFPNRQKPAPKPKFQRASFENILSAIADTPPPLSSPPPPPKTHEEAIEDLIFSKGLTDYDLKVFQLFQKKLIPAEVIERNAYRIVEVGCLLAEHFPERKEYEGFRRQ